MLTTVTYYRLPRDQDDKPNSYYNRLFTMALRWQPEIDVPVEMVSSRTKKLKESVPTHAGVTALHALGDAGEISERGLNAAIAYLESTIAHYRSASDEPYPGRNVEAIGDLLDLLNELTGSRRVAR